MGNRKHDCAIADESGSPWRLIPLEKVRKKKSTRLSFFVFFFDLLSW